MYDVNDKDNSIRITELYV